MKRREIITKVPAIVIATQIACMPNKAEAIDPITLAIILGIIPAGASMYSARVQADAQIQAQKETAAMYIRLQDMQQDFQKYMVKINEEFEMRKIRTQLGLVNVVQEVAYTRDGQPARMVITRSIDGSGTVLGVNGNYGASRSQYNGTFSNVEANILAEELKVTGVMPVPVDEGYSNVNSAQANELARYFGKDERIISTRKFSKARYPTKSGADVMTVHYAKNNNTVDAKLFNLG